MSESLTLLTDNLNLIPKLTVLTLFQPACPASDLAVIFDDNVLCFIGCPVFRGEIGKSHCVILVMEVEKLRLPEFECEERGVRGWEVCWERECRHKGRKQAILAEIEAQLGSSRIFESLLEVREEPVDSHFHNVRVHLAQLALD